MMVPILLYFCVTFALLYLYCKNRLSFWQNKGIKCVPTSVFDAFLALFYDPIPFVIQYKNIYDRLDGHEYGGCYKAFEPLLVIRDPELIKSILIKDFDHFRDRGSVHFNKYDTITHVLFTLPGNSLWRTLRLNLTQAYTSSKMKSMFPSVNQFADEYRRNLGNLIENGQLLDAQNFAQSYALDIVATTAFGLRLKSLASSESYFKKMIHLTAMHSFRPLINRIIHEWFPFLRRYILISARPKPIRDFLYGMVYDIEQYRKDNAIVNNDVFQILMHLYKNKPTKNEENQPEITIDHVAGQIFLFFIAGSHPLSIIVSTTLLELAANKRIQKKLHDEIDENIMSDSNDGEMNYDILKNMSYLDKVIQETLRKYPPVPYISRVCTKSYRLSHSDKIIESGTEVIIPVGGLFNDEQFFRKPDEYRPERFDDDEKHKNHDSIFIPFGDGPRICIGNRFALMNAKLCLVHLLKHYNFETTSATVYPIAFEPNVFFTKLNHPILLKCNPRSASVK